MKITQILLGISLILSTAQHLSARVGELEAEIEKRYGQPVSHFAYQQMDRNAIGQTSDHDFTAPLTREPIQPKIEATVDDPTDLTRPEGVSLSDRHLFFFDTKTNEWLNFRSSILGRISTSEDSAGLQKMTATATEHFKQRFYLIDDISVSVVFLGGRSVSEFYKQKGVMFGKDSIYSFIKKSFPDAKTIEEGDIRQGSIVVKLLSADNQLVGCATCLAGDLKISATPYYTFLNALELGLKGREASDREKKLNDF